MINHVITLTCCDDNNVFTTTDVYVGLYDGDILYGCECVGEAINLVYGCMDIESCTYNPSEYSGWKVSILETSTIIT